MTSRLLLVLVWLASPALLAQSTQAPPGTATPSEERAAAPVHPLAPQEGVPLPPEFRWDLPEVMEVIEIPGEQMAMGIPMKLNAVRSRSSFQKAYGHILESFNRAGLYVAPAQHLNIPMSDPMLTGVDSVRLITYSAIFKPNPDGTTTLILGEAHVARRQKKETFFAPLPSNAEAPMQSSIEGMRTLVFRTAAPGTEMESFYRRSLGEAGFREIEPLLFRRDRSLVRVRISRDEGKTLVTIVDSPQLPNNELVRPH